MLLILRWCGAQAWRGLSWWLARLKDWSAAHPREARITGSVFCAVMLGFVLLRPDSLRDVDLMEELECLALNIYHEARGEPEVGQVAVGQVVLNRVAHERFPSSICGVVKQGGEDSLHRCQFSWWCDGNSDQPHETMAWAASQDLAKKVLAGEYPDPTEGAMWYHADYVAPDWRGDFDEGPKIGRHIFYRVKN